MTDPSEDQLRALLSQAEPWKAEVELDDEQARALLAGAFPELDGRPTRELPIELLGVGWDNAAFLVGGEWVFRFPRRQIAAGLIETEVELLPALASRLPAPVPVPELVGRAGASGVAEAYPWTFAGYRRLPGETACSAGLSDDERQHLAGPLGAFLRALHDTPAALAERAPADPFRKTDVALRAPAVREKLRELGPLVDEATLGRALALVDELEEKARPEDDRPRVLVHGDLYARHLLVDAERRFAGMIDWGDLSRADPAVDLSIVFSFLPRSARPAFEEAYGPLDEDTVTRARFRALHYAAILWPYGRSVDDAALVEAGRYAFSRSLDPP